MLIHFMVVLIVTFGHFVGLLSLGKVTLQLIQDADLELGVHSAFHREVACQYTVLEIAHRLVKLICFSEDHPKFIKEFRLLLKVWRHFEDSNQC